MASILNASTAEDATEQADEENAQFTASDHCFQQPAIPAMQRTAEWPRWSSMPVTWRVASFHRDRAALDADAEYMPIANARVATRPEQPRSVLELRSANS
jgi:hypothetical protein